MKAYMILCILLTAGWSTVHYSRHYTQCIRHAKSPMENYACYDSELKYQDKRLNQNYQALRQQIRARLGKQEAAHKQRALRDVQKLWLKFRDKNCAFRILYGESMEVGFARACMVCMTAERADELATLADY